jgi:hypothetical protein
LRQSSQSINTFAPPLLEGFVSSHLHPDNAREIYLALLQPLHQPSINTHTHTLNCPNHQPPTTNHQPPLLLLYQPTNPTQPQWPPLPTTSLPWLPRTCLPAPDRLPHAPFLRSPLNRRRLDASTPRLLPSTCNWPWHTSTSISIHDYYAVIRPRLFNTRPPSHPWRCRRARLHWQAPCRVWCTLCIAPPTGHDLARPTG